MNDLDRLLHDPRSYRAVPEQEMAERVTRNALQQWKQGTARLGTSTRFRKWPIGLSLLLLAGFLSGWLFHDLPRYDLHLKYWLLDQVDAIGAGVIQQPLATALYLAGAAALLGFALSAQARASLSRNRP
jgi:hypothetical protein